MTNLPTPKLGAISAITMTSPDLEHSLTFYRTLGFNEILRSDMPFPWIQITDGALLIMLRLAKEPYIALTYYVKEIERAADELEAEGVAFAVKPAVTDWIKRYVIKTPDNANVSLVTYVDGFYRPAGNTLLTTPPADFANPEKYTNPVCGIFGELAYPVTNMEASARFWEKLGFKVLSAHDLPYKWSILSDGLSIVGLHETKTFSSPAITFFAGDMKSKIERLKAAGLTGFTDKGTANATLATPEGQHINLFKLGM